MAALVDRFGAESVYGRRLRFSELHQIIVAENVRDAYNAYKAAAATEGGAAEFGQEHPELAAIVMIARKAAYQND